MALDLPDRQALFARAGQYGRNRFQAGTHFPSDLEAGKIAAAVIAEALLRDPRFRQDLAEAAEEARRGGATLTASALSPRFRPSPG